MRAFLNGIQALVMLHSRISFLEGHSGWVYVLLDSEWNFHIPVLSGHCVWLKDLCPVITSGLRTMPSCSSGPRTMPSHCLWPKDYAQSFFWPKDLCPVIASGPRTMPSHSSGPRTMLSHCLWPKDYAQSFFWPKDYAKSLPLAQGLCYCHHESSMYHYL